MFSRLSAFIFKLWGWKITGQYPYQVPKVVIACGPHTSNWDFPLGVLSNSILRANANYVGKAALFRWPYGWLFRYWGGIPVERTRKTNFVEQVVKAFRERERVHLAMSPEGTRKKVEKFRTGFYYIALGAGAPICLCQFDWAKREIFFDPQLFYPTGDEQKDLAFIWEYFKNVQGHTPENGIG